MAIERKWAAVPATAFTADGTQFGIVTVADTIGFKVKQLVILKQPSLGPTELQVKYVISNTQLVVGPGDNKVGPQYFQSIVGYTVAGGAVISAVVQDKSQIPDKDHYLAVYETDPIVADRSILVDPYGNFYDENNPFPAMFSGSVSIGAVEIKDPNGNIASVNDDGTLNVVVVDGGGSGTSTVVNKFAQSVDVPASTPTTINTYTCPGGATATLQRISVSGDNVAVFTVMVNSAVVDVKRTYWGNFNVDFKFNTDASNGGLSLNPGDVVTIQGVHSSNSLGEFDARIQAVQLVP